MSDVRIEDFIETYFLNDPEAYVTDNAIYRKFVTWWERNGGELSYPQPYIKISHKMRSFLILNGYRFQKTPRTIRWIGLRVKK